ncbi:Scr1 family TA system antitoxin-like transcriptional regulator [Actinoallomurus soli]|uniref:Scr1 family TA system antitoxin-like transcriptional regulator n=1 Tax=Actinoallomurus soli TaxID=2952535 RepID=UPI002092636E|nr:Scr1 family TA system antitoxin-like transcriptional regulator [Actinoallomurus soli]MCO5967550.1 Scr1 family TA system antitoxin-like transcriptional regulator [Actinoallomurus soli]
MSFRESPDPKSSMWALIAYYLRFCRQQRKLNGDLMGEVLGGSKSTVSRLETGEMRLDETRAKAIDRKWQTGGIFSLLVWYATLGHDPDWFKQYLDLEARAKVIRIWELALVPGLFQTADYARAGLASGGVSDVDAALEHRLARQAVLDREDAPVLWALLSESLLETPCGGRDVMRAQLAHILELSERPNIGVRVVPKAVGHHPGLDGAFMILRLADPFGEVAYVEAPGGGRLVPNIDEVTSFDLRYERIGHQALPETASRDMIKQIMEVM